jgi:cell cycle checkpoint protein
MTGTCRISYYACGDPLSIILEESGVTTTCELATYEPEFKNEIPFQTDGLASKIIMKASLLYDAITELSSTSPTRLTIAASPAAPHFTLSSSGPFGSAMVEFSKNPDALEKFEVRKRAVNTYKYSLIKGASRAMAIASKVSIRADVQGVLSLQFMIVGDGGAVSFVDFRFVPFELEEGEEEEGEDEDEDEEDEDEDEEKEEDELLGEI